MLYTVKVKANSDSLSAVYNFGTDSEPVVIEHEHFDTDEIEVVTIETPRKIDAVLDANTNVIEYNSEHTESDDVNGEYKELPNGDGVNVWFNRFEEKWYGCWSGTYRGIYSESEDIELYATNQTEALDEIVDYYNMRDES